ncbi:MAG TPA: tetratricopeptide repeat protein, partial [Blastocatellia bacterium]|nr:tetratricopeptide repeat protein [Blastocatellia bacterium]
AGGSVGSTRTTVCGSAEECLQLSRSYAAILDWNSAVTVLKKAIALDPSNVRAYKDLASAYIGPSLANIARHSKEECLRAEDACRAALSLDARDPEAYLLLGSIMNEELSNEYRSDDEAIGVIRTAIALRPRYADAYCELARAYTLLKRYDDALEAYGAEVAIRQETRLREHASNTAGSDALVDDSNRQHEFSDAIQAVDNCKKLGRNQDALARLQKLETVDPGADVIHFMVGQELVKLGDLNSAKREQEQIEHICLSKNHYLVTECEGYAKGLADAIQGSR